MGVGFHGGFGNTFGRINYLTMDLQLFASRAIAPTGAVTEKSISEHREFFFGKSAGKLSKILNKYGYKTRIRPSTHSASKAKIVVTLNPSKNRNISQIQVSPGSRRHGNVPYVKISTTNAGIFKIINSSSKAYKSDGTEKAKLLFRRRRKQ